MCVSVNRRVWNKVGAGGGISSRLKVKTLHWLWRCACLLINLNTKGYVFSVSIGSGQLRGGPPPSIMTGVVNDLHELGGSLIGTADSTASDWPVSITSMAHWGLWPLQAQRFHLQLSSYFAVTILATSLCDPCEGGVEASRYTQPPHSASNVVAVVRVHLARPCGNLNANLQGQS